MRMANLFTTMWPSSTPMQRGLALTTDVVRVYRTILTISMGHCDGSRKQLKDSEENELTTLCNELSCGNGVTTKGKCSSFASPIHTMYQMVKYYYWVRIQAQSSIKRNEGLGETTTAHKTILFWNDRKHQLDVYL